MKTHKLILCFYLACSMLLFGCPYEAKFPLSNSNVSLIDTTLVGSWNEISAKEDEQAMSIDVTIFNDHEYLAQTMMREKGSLMIQNFRTFETTVNHQKFLNVQATGNKPKFNFYKYAVSEDTLKISAISDNFSKQQFKNKEELFAFIEKNMNDPKFYEKESVLIKRKK